MTPLHIAADCGRVDFAKALHDAVVDVDPINVFGHTPLWVTVMRRRRTRPDGSMIRLLLDQGAGRRSEQPARDDVGQRTESTAARMAGTSLRVV
jgi:ankyrin repeat protein